MIVSTEQLPELEQTTSTQVEGTQPFVSYPTAVQLGRWQTSNDWVTGTPLLLGDTVAAFLSVVLLQLMAANFGWNAISTHAIFTVGVVGFTLLIQHIHGLYPACGLPHSLEFRRLLRTSLIVISAVALGWLMQHPRVTFPIIGILFFGCLLPLMLAVTRSVLRALLAGCDWWAQPVLIIGDGLEGNEAFVQLDKNRREGLRPIGIAFESESHWAGNDDGGQYIGPAGQIESLLQQSRACRVMLTNRDAGKSVDFFAYNGIPHVTLPTDLGYHPTERTRLNERNGTIELHCYSAVTAPGAQLAKRILDLGLILLASPALVPLFAVLSVLVRISSPGPIFFGSKRKGIGGELFKAWKFRSMVVNGHEVLERHFAEHPEDRAIFERDHKLKNDPRITRIGRFLRKTSLDELPQLINVLRGEMSLVGPRPILEDEHAKYGQVYDLYVTMRPGITGLWQVSGRNNLEYEERLRYTRFYVQNWSCTLDLYILWRTIKTALFQEGAY